MTNKAKMKNIKQVIDDIEISDIVEPTIPDFPRMKVIPDFPTEKLMETLGAIDWKLWEILKILQKFDEDEQEESDD